jgi:hypothetical protein
MAYVSGGFTGSEETGDMSSVVKDESPQGVVYERSELLGM